MHTLAAPGFMYIYIHTESMLAGRQTENAKSINKMDPYCITLKYMYINFSEQTNK